MVTYIKQDTDSGWDSLQGALVKTKAPREEMTRPENTLLLQGMILDHLFCGDLVG